MSQYTHIFFDHDGVLVDTEGLYFHATQSKLGELGVDLLLSAYLKLQAHGANAWQQAMDLGWSRQEVEAKRAERNDFYHELLRTESIDIPDVEEVLAILKEQHTLAIVTTAKQVDFDLIHADRNIVPYMDLVLTNKDYQHSKPHPEPYLTALEHFGVAPDRALVVEDSERGLRAAVAANIDCATVYHPFTAPQDFSSATYRLGVLRELLTILA